LGCIFVVEALKDLELGDSVIKNPDGSGFLDV
jgi:hypothetical protein